MLPRFSILVIRIVFLCMGMPITQHQLTEISISFYPSSHFCSALLFLMQNKNTFSFSMNFPGFTIENMWFKCNSLHDTFSCGWFTSFLNAVKVKVIMGIVGKKKIVLAATWWQCCVHSRILIWKDSSLFDHRDICLCMFCSSEDWGVRKTGSLSLKT